MREALIIGAAGSAFLQSREDLRRSEERFAREVSARPPAKLLPTLVGSFLYSGWQSNPQERQISPKRSGHSID